MEDHGASPEPREDAPGTGALVSQWVANAGERVRTTLHLVVAETRLAAVSLGLMVFLMVLAAGSAMLAWVVLVITVVVALKIAGLQLVGVLAGLIVVHGVLAWMFWGMAMRLSRHLGFEATRRELGGEEEPGDTS